MKTFVLENVRVVIETEDDNLTEAEALEMLQKPFLFKVSGVGHEASTGKIVIGFTDEA